MHSYRILYYTGLDKSYVVAKSQSSLGGIRVGFLRTLTTLYPSLLSGPLQTKDSAMDEIVYKAA